MQQTSKPKLLFRLFIRNLLVVGVVIPISLLYDSTLTSLTVRQMEVQTQIIGIMLPPILLFVFFVFRRHLRPLTRAIDLAARGEAISPDDFSLAERRALLLPYIDGAYLVLFFFLIALATNLTLYLREGLRFELFVYLVASSGTTALMMGLGSSFLVRPVFRDGLRFIVPHDPRTSLTPPPSIPIALKVTVSFTLIVAMILVFSGLLSSVLVTRAVARERAEAQRAELNALVRLLPAPTPASALAELSGPDHCLLVASADFNLAAGCQPPDPGALAALKRVAAGQAVVSADTGWTWLTAPLPSGGTLLSGRAPLQTSTLARELAKYFGAAALVALLVAAAVGYLIARDIAVTLRQLSEAAARIAEGAVDAPLITGSDDETGALARAFNRMNRVLLSQLRQELERGRNMIAAISGALHTLRPMSQELTAFTDEQASSSLEQAAAAAESAATCTEVATIAQQISKTSGQVVEAAEGTLQAAILGQERIQITRGGFDDLGHKVEAINDAVAKLSENSRAIGGIIDIIEEISDQTHLVALNAALEAAGAGEYGNRFAVVAAEVLRLAENAGRSAKDVMTIIASMQAGTDEARIQAAQAVEAVAEGMKAVEEIEEIFAGVHQASREAADLVKNIDAITLQQASATTQMLRSMSEVRDTAQHGAEAARKLQASVQAVTEIMLKLEEHTK